MFLSYGLRIVLESLRTFSVSIRRGHLPIKDSRYLQVDSDIKVLMYVLVSTMTTGLPASGSKISTVNVPFLIPGISSWEYTVVVFDLSNIQYHTKSISNKV